MQIFFATILWLLIQANVHASGQSVYEIPDSSIVCFKGSFPSVAKASESLDRFQSCPSNSIDPHYRGDIWYSMIIPKSKTDFGRRDGISFGNISDADEMFIENQSVGGHGVFHTSHGVDEFLLLPHIERVYRFPFALEKDQRIFLRVAKVAGDATGVGIVEKVKIGEFRTLHLKSKIRYLFRSIIPLLAGSTFLFFGLYHMVLYFLLRRRSQFLWLAHTLMFCGLFVICYSFIPYELFQTPQLILTLHALGSFWGIYSFGRFLFIETSSQLISRFMKAQLIVVAFFSLAVVLSKSFDQGLNFYFAWYAVFIPTLVFYFTYQTFFDSKRNDKQKRVSILSIISICIGFGHDILLTLRYIHGDPWSIYGFIGVIVLSTLNLARQFSFAYLDVELTVKERTIELASAYESLKSLEQMKQRFFTNISHDFKTPLAILQTQLQKLAAKTDMKDQKVLDSCQKTLVKMKTMITDLLTSVRGNESGLSFMWGRIPIKKNIVQWAENFDPLLKEKGIKLTLDLKIEPDLAVVGDEKRLERCFENLMSNALKFATRDGNIHLRCYSSESQILIEVEDDGPGVAVENREKVLGRFFQVVDQKSALLNRDGYGIGLSFVKECMDGMNGVVKIENGNKYHSKFVLALPLRQSVPSNAVVTNLNFEEEASLPRLKLISEQAYPATATAVEDPSRDSVLVAEDNVELAHIVVDALKDVFNVYFAPNGKVALSLLGTHRIHCILSDIMMPEMNGTEFLKKVRQGSLTSTIPFILLSTIDEKESIVEHLKLGAQDYVTKPFERDILLARVRTHIETQKLRDRVLQAEKFSTLGVLAAGVSHEIRNPLSTAKNMLAGIYKVASPFIHESVRDPMQIDDSGQVAIERYQKILKAVDLSNKSLARIDQIVRSVGVYSAASHSMVETSSVKLIEDVLSLLEGSLNDKSIVIQQSLEDVPLVVYSSLYQAVLNVCANAIDSVDPQTGRIELSAKSQFNGIILSVKDNGVGVSPDIQRFLFSPFVTTKEPGKGIGLGLYISRQIIEDQHRGRLEYVSLDHGSQFNLYIPSTIDFKSEASVKNFHGHRMRG